MNKKFQTNNLKSSIKENFLLHLNFEYTFISYDYTNVWCKQKTFKGTKIF